MSNLHKGDTLKVENYRRFSLLDTIYKITKQSYCTLEITSKSTSD